MRKKGLLTTLFIFNLMLMFGAGNSVEAKELKKFVRDESGTLGYSDTIKVPLYSGSSEIIDIPETYEAPKELFQSSWVATIQNLNIQKPSNEAEFKQNYLKILSDFKEWNMNAMIFQVRPLLDSWYPSEINPWSEFLVGNQGTDPGYDPLTWMVEETHKQGMEYHAWLNPYRVSNTKFNNANLQKKTGKTEAELAKLSIIELVKLFNKTGILADNNYAVLHPEQVLIFDQKLFLNPGVPEVRQHVFDTVEELVRNYDIDAIHFDDYFYPYRITVDGVNVFFGTEGEDQATFTEYGQDFSSIDEWRRHNIDLLAEGVKETIVSVNKELKKSVQFGVSPFGIWEHKGNNELGSNTPLGSSQSYSGSIFADTYKWVKEETVDYMAPQIYWSFDQAAAPYGELTQWWNNVAEGTHTQIYIGHANYKHVSNGGWDVSWLNPEEVPNQLKFNTKYNNVKGSAFFSYNDIQYSDINSLADNLKERHTAKNTSIDLLKKDYFNQLTLVPAKTWLSQGEVLAPKEVEVKQNQLTWQASENGNERFYIIYAGEGALADVTSNSKNIVDRIYNDGSQTFTYTLPNNLQGNVYMTSTDAAGVESAPFVKEIPVVNGQVVVNYKEEKTGKELGKVVLEGAVGSKYEIQLKEFEGYNVVKPEFSLVGEFKEETQTIEIFYTAETTDTTSTTDSSSTTDSTSSTSTTDSSSTTDSTSTTSTTDSSSMTDSTSTTSTTDSSSMTDSTSSTSTTDSSSTTDSTSSTSTTTTDTTGKGTTGGGSSSNSKEYVPVKSLPQTGESTQNLVYVAVGLFFVAASAIVIKKKVKD